MRIIILLVNKPTIDDYETISAGSLCALCRSETPAAEGRVLGFIALVQPTKILTSKFPRNFT